MSKGGGGGTTTTETQSAPWEIQAPYLQSVYRRAVQLPQQQPYPFPGVVPFSPATAQAQIAQTQRAMAGSPLTRIGQQEVGRTAAGDYLYGGPGFDRALEAAHSRIAPMVRGQFEGRGRYGGGLQQLTEMQALGDIFAGQYGAERGRQLQAAGAAPGMAQQDYFDIGQLARVGAQQEARAAQALSDAQNRWQFQQQAPFQQLGAMSNVIQGGYPGGTQTVQTPNQQMSPLAGAMGGGMLGSSLGGALVGEGALFGGALSGLAPWAMPIGAGLGLLGSM